MSEVELVRNDLAHGVNPTSDIAVIDVGSNTTRLVLFETTPAGGLRSVYETKEIPRLGQDLGPDHSLAPAAIERGYRAMRRFARQLEMMGEPPVIAVATSAVRDAPNGPEFVRRVRRDANIALRIIPPEEEARLAYLGVAGAWELDRDAIFDLGGGSLQAITTQEGKIDHVESVRLGALRLTDRFLRHDPPKRHEIDDLRSHVEAELRHVPRFQPRKDSELFAVGGTMRSVARVSISHRHYPLPQVHGYALSRVEIEELCERFVHLKTDRRRDIEGLSGHRADVIIAGCLVAEELLDRFDLPGITVSGTGIREGIVYDRLQVPLPGPSEILAHRSVTAAARAFGFSLPHGDQVCRTAVELFDLLADRYGWQREERLALMVAAWMHDVGSVIEIWRHPVHSAYLLRHAAVFGLSHRQTLLASLAAAMHEGDEPPGDWVHQWRPPLRPRDDTIARGLGLLLFTAETLDGSAVRFRLRRSPRALVIRPAGPKWLAPSDRTTERLRKPFRRVLGLEVVTDAN
jgi:exopolyphosphatase/guanosine-5'-triphosphate,3'-diphosphate pyrophosphatase